MSMDISRRSFFALGGVAFASMALAGLPRTLFAQTVSQIPSINLRYTASKLKIIYMDLAGGPDGLELVAPYADPNYISLRQGLSRGRPGSNKQAPLNLNGFFGISYRLPKLKELYDKGQYIPVHAAGLGHTNRSHFDAAKIMQGAYGYQNGGSNFNLAPTGWLYRAVRIIAQKASMDEAAARFLGLVPYASAPYILEGKPNLFMYDPGPVEEFPGAFWSRYADSICGSIRAGKSSDYCSAIRQSAAMRQQFETYLGALPMEDQKTLERSTRSMHSAVDRSTAVGLVMSRPDSPRFAAIQLGGFDSHNTQNPTEGYGEVLQVFNDSIAALQKTLGAEWENTVIIAGGEFGRTCAANGTGGTDHGIGGVWHLAGGAVKGGKVITDWPGLAPSAMVDGRYLRVTTNVIGLFKGILQQGFELSAADIDAIFPYNTDIRPALGVI